MSEDETAPLLRIESGRPSDEELSAVVALFAARSARGGPAEPEPLRKPLHPWVASGLVKGTRTRA